MIPRPPQLPTDSLWAVDPNVRPQDRDRLSEQCRIVLDLLRSKSITEADVYPKIKRLAARVHDLRNHGYQILDRWDGPTKRYWMEGKQ